MTEPNDKTEHTTEPGASPSGITHRLSQQVKFGHQAWMDRLRVMQDVETAFTKELLATRDPNEALKVCNRWIAKRLELLATDSRDFTGFWMDLVMTAAGSAQLPGAPPKRGEGT